MVITTDTVDVGGMRTLVCTPRPEGRYPGVVFFSDIFQLTEPMVRACARLAGYGYVVAGPEIYHRLEPPGTVLEFDDAGKERGLADARRTPVAHFDADARAALDYLAGHERVAEGRVGAAGFCIGGHLAFRAALQPDVLATACWYATGVHDGELGADPDAGSLSRAGEIRGELLMIFGTLDPHVDETGRSTIEDALRAAGTSHRISLYEAEHAFQRDIGPRYDPEATDRAWAEMIELFDRALKL